ncbi:hypothetical protein MTE01_16770 [Microbacterium testaceum]|uniref:Uncharacterized protein n=1 Tax=Microbacterium testaceum TaxID=2033 RepID=A0A4Y3QKQ6_MICTE|nr:hypothetical protein MTE01_16770 [Microbacterium testaceum]
MVRFEVGARGSLAAAIKREDEARAALDEAHAAVAAARRTALARGWEERELKKLGLASATRPSRGRKAKPAAPTNTETSEESRGEDHA